ncbi:MAG TPA: ribosome-associated translation inhibitor RaiA [Candidatus Saccharimonadales bacterium]|nr:ribosome-associated translation inhibitor RaiA [Candidatus Saccharimonadales bacterium]
MLQRFEIQGVGMTVDESLKRYTNRKIGGLDKYLSKHDRESAHASVTLKERATKKDDHCTCEVVLHLPHQQIIIKESALNMYAAIDIVEAKLKQQIKKYKDKHENGKSRRRLVARWTRRQA